MLYRIAWSSRTDMTRHYTPWTDDRDLAVIMFHHLAGADNACSLFIQHKRKEDANA